MCNGNGLRSIDCSRPSTSRRGPTAEELLQLLDARHARANFFGAHLFADPAWEILLLAYVALLENERLLVSSLFQKSIVPPTTSLRWADVLEQDGLLIHHKDEVDGAQPWLELSAAGIAGMERYFSVVWPSIVI